MNKLHINLYVPNRQKWFDINVSKEATIEELKEMIIGLLKNETSGYITLDSDSILCSYDDGFIYD